MQPLGIYVFLFAVIVVIGQVFRNSPIPISLLLVIAGMLLSLIPHFPTVSLNPNVVLDFFLPLLVYQISSFSSWDDFRKNLRPIALLSVGHVLFITGLIAVVVHSLIPQFSWPLAFVLGAVIAPPDSVAIVSIAEKIRMPLKVVTILEGEGMLNDATALILFRFSLAAVVTHHFSFSHAFMEFFAVIIGEVLYGLLLGYVLGELRLRLRNPVLHIMTSVLTPFFAYLPPERLGGCGVIATVVTGFVIGHIYSIRFTPDFRLVSRAVWPALAFTIQGILFLLVGLDFHAILSSFSAVPVNTLVFYGTAVALTVILGRFLWVYLGVAFLPRTLFPAIRRANPEVPWQYPFMISWAGMRGGISLAAALAVPYLYTVVGGIHPRSLLIFLVFCVIAVTLLLQGLTLPWLIKAIKLNKYTQREKHDEHIAELSARIIMAKSVLRWLLSYKEQVKDNPKMLAEVGLHIQEYRMLKKQLKEKMGNHNGNLAYDEQAEIIEETFLARQILKVERTELLQLWRADAVNINVKNKLLERLDHRSKHLPD
jgi:CPA1 family monovalent cation:H+ antiporter